MFALLVYCVVVEIKLGERRKESCGAKLRPLLLSHALNYIALKCGAYRPLHELPEVEFSTTALSLHILFLVLCFALAQSTCFLLSSPLSSPWSGVLTSNFFHRLITLHSSNSSFPQPRLLTLRSNPYMPRTRLRHHCLGAPRLENIRQTAH